MFDGLLGSQSIVMTTFSRKKFTSAEPEETFYFADKPFRATFSRVCVFKKQILELTTVVIQSFAYSTQLLNAQHKWALAVLCLRTRK